MSSMPPETSNLAFALLAAGRSRRFAEGRKLEQPFGTMALGLYTACHGASISFQTRFVVTRSDCRIDYTSLGYSRLVVGDTENVQSASLRAAVLASRSAGVNGLLVALADMPFADAGHLCKLIDAHAAAGDMPIFSRTAGGILQPPALIPATWFPALLETRGDVGARSLKKWAQGIDSSEEQMLDIDTLDDLDRARTILAKLSS